MADRCRGSLDRRARHGLSSAAIIGVVLLAAVCLMFPSETALAQRQGRPGLAREIRGQVRLAGNETPLREVIVRLESEGGGIINQVTTDELGKFVFGNLSNSIYYVTLHAPGFRDARERIDLSVAARAFVQLYLVTTNESRTGPAAGPATVSVATARIPEEAAREISKAKEDLSKNKPESAVRRLKKAIEAYPDAAEAHFLLGTAKADLGDPDAAEKELKRAIELDEKLAGAYFALGDLYNFQQNYAEAERILLKGLELDDASWQGHFALGKTYWAAGDAAKAEPHARIAHDMMPSFPQVHILMGNIYLRKGESRQAVGEFEDYLKLEPEGRLSAAVREMIRKIRQGDQRQ